MGLLALARYKHFRLGWHERIHEIKLPVLPAMGGENHLLCSYEKCGCRTLVVVEARRHDEFQNVLAHTCSFVSYTAAVSRGMMQAN